MHEGRAGRQGTENTLDGDDGLLVEVLPALVVAHAQDAVVVGDVAGVIARLHDKHLERGRSTEHGKVLNSGLFPVGLVAARIHRIFLAVRPGIVFERVLIVIDHATPGVVGRLHQLRIVPLS